VTLDDFSRATPNAIRLMAELGFLVELAQVAASYTELQPILDWIVQKTTTMLRADEGAIRLLDPDVATPLLKTLIRKETAGISAGSWPPQIGTTVMGFLMAKGEPLATPDLVADPRFIGLKGFETHIRSVLAVPLKMENRFTGLLAVTQSTPGRQWRQDEIQLLSIVAATSAGVIEQARLRQEEAKRKVLEERARQMEKDLKLARVIQMSLPPAVPLRVGSWLALGKVSPAQQVGGDTFEYFSREDGRLGFAIADVEGKGIAAALLTMNVQPKIRASLDGHADISRGMRHLNLEVIRQSAGAGKFITLFYGDLDPERRVIRYSNAGHDPPLLRRRDGTLIKLEEGGFPLGLFETAEYPVGEVGLEPGDSLLLFSDGVVDALNVHGKDFGEERLEALWRNECRGEPAAMIDRLMTEIEGFRGRAPQNDDITLVVVAETPEP
jgi:sigma-B regulation protein RsbU (phosphoserine phosphatase)